MPTTEPTTTRTVIEPDPRLAYADGVEAVIGQLASVPRRILQWQREVKLWANRISPEGDSETPPEGGGGGR